MSVSFSAAAGGRQGLGISTMGARAHRGLSASVQGLWFKFGIVGWS